MAARTPEPDAPPALYVALVSTTRPTERSLERAGYSRSYLDRELPRLADLGMVRLLERGAIEVVPPEVALPAYAAHLEGQATRTRSAIDELGGRYRRSRAQRAESATFEVRVASDLAELEEARRRVMRDAEEAVVVVAARAPLNERLILDRSEHSNGLRGPGAAQLRRRLILDRSILEVDGVAESLAELHEDGVQVRIHPSLALSVIVVDRAVAIVDITNLDPSGYGSIIVRHPPLVEALALMADATVITSSPAPVALSGAQERLGQRQAKTLALLAAGASDATIARQLGVSQRTVERHVRMVMDSLGATTRFQAGMEAARRGLL